MGGKLPLLGIVGFGLFAAICAAVLMAVLRIEPQGAGAAIEAPAMHPIVVVTSDVPALSRLTLDDLETKHVTDGDRPDAAFGDTAALIGRVVTAPLLEGQAVTPSDLLDEVGGAKLALSLPEGIRAVSIELSATSALRGLLYPGCTVDVIGVTRNNAETSKTLVHDVRVLAVNDRTLYADDTEDAEEDAPPRRSTGDARRTMVTLMVTPEQARTLQAARERGSLSLSMRNPLDRSAGDPDAPPADASSALEPEPDPEPAVWTVRVVRSGEATVRAFGGPDRLTRVPGDADSPAPRDRDAPSGDDR